MKKVLCILICLLTALLLSACSGTYSYTLDDSEGAVITKYNGNAAELIVPSVIDGHPVKSIGRFVFLGHKELTSVTLPQGLESISDEAFGECLNLTTITLPEGLEFIGSYAFSGCINLPALKLPDSVKAMGVNPFSRCEKLKEIIISPDHPVFTLIDGVIFNKVENELFCYPDSKKNKSYIVPDGVKSIGEDAFFSCDNITSVTLPQGLESIGYGAFASCYNLTSITLPQGLKTIGSSAFAGDPLTSITLPQGLKSIDAHAFSGCSFTSITLPEGLEVIGSQAFKDCVNLTTVNLPDSVKTIESNPFSGCRKLEEILLNPNHPVFTSIDGVLFNKVEKNLIRYPESKKNESYTVPDGVQSIGNFAFKYCNNLASVTLPDGLTFIGERAFSYCDNLASITLPQGLETISFLAFDHCPKLTSITLPASITFIDDIEFEIGTTLTVKYDSYAEKWAKKKGYQYRYLE